LALNGNSVDIGQSTLAAIDTGTTLLGGPTEAVQNFWTQVPQSVALTGQNEGFFAFRTFFLDAPLSHNAPSPIFKLNFIFIVACNTQLNASLSFGGKQWPINPQDMNLGQVQGSRSLCMGGLFDVTQGAATNAQTPSWIVGDTFLVRSLKYWA
jgi:cathepsin D